MKPRPEVVISLCALLVSVVAVGLGVWSTYADYRYKRLEKLVLIDQYLHQTEFSEARSAVSQGTAGITIQNPSVHRVCSSFDFASMLVRQGAMDKEMFVEYWRPSLVLLAKRLKPIWDESVGEGVTAKEYYKDFHWLLQEVAP